MVPFLRVYLFMSDQVDMSEVKSQFDFLPQEKNSSTMS